MDSTGEAAVSPAQKILCFNVKNNGIINIIIFLKLLANYKLYSNYFLKIIKHSKYRYVLIKYKVVL